MRKMSAAPKKRMFDMEDRPLSPKEIQILDAAAALMVENISAISSLKVADIAAAGVGKGTVYEYFSSKEVILRDAVIRFVTKHIEEEWQRAFAQPTFKDCVYCAMNEIFSPSDGLCIWDLQLLATLDYATMEDIIDFGKSFCLKIMREMCRQLMERGAAEGLFVLPPQEQSEQAFVHLFGGFSLIMRFGDREKQKEYMDRGYEMLLRALQ